MTMRYNITSALGLIFIVSLAAARTADGQVPTLADFTACNEEAPKAVKAGSASPTTGDLARAGNFRTDGTPPSPIHDKGKVIESSDPQIHGMNAEGARNASYQAAYRSCMRRKGF